MKSTSIYAAIIAAAALALPANAQDDFRNLDAPAPLPAAGVAATAKAQSKKTTDGMLSEARASFSDTSKPGTLKLNVPYARIEVKGSDTKEIIVTSTLEKKDAAKADDDGFRRLDDETSFDLVEKDNVATLRVASQYNWMPAGAEFKISVPRNTNLVIKTQVGDKIEIDGVEGDVDVSTVSSDILLENVGGAIAASTMGGKITAVFEKTPKKPLTLTTTSGNIDCTLPEKAAANLRMRTMNGNVRTNFPESALKTTSSFAGSGEGKKIERRVINDDKSGAVTVTANADENIVVTTTGNGSGYAYSVAPASPAASSAPVAVATTSGTVSDSDLMSAIVETRTAQVREYVDKSMVAAQRGIDAALKAIDSTGSLSADEKELIKRKIQSASAKVIPQMPRVPKIPAIGGKTITGNLNGGGADIRLTTLDGYITVRKGK